jgi:hypothetical protein
MVAADDTIGEKLVSPMNSPRLSLDDNATTLNPLGYSRLHTLAHVAVNQKMVVCNLLIPSGTTDHTKLVVVSHQIQMNWCRGIHMNAYGCSTKIS